MSTQQPLAPSLEAFIAAMPKVELHLHLEGAVQPATLLRIAERNRVELPARDVAGVAQLFNYRHFHEFLTVFMVLARSLMRGEDFELLAYELGHQLADQNVRYAEVMVSAFQYFNRGIDLGEVVQGAMAGFARAERERGTRVRLAFDYGRQFGAETAWKVLELAIQNMRYGLVAWSIGGDELNYPPELFAEVFAAARRAGLHLMAHAGEVVGPASVWGAVDVLRCERIGHGIRSIDDPALLAHLRALGVVLDVSPSSNLYTGAVPDMASHPLRRLFDAGVTITLNTDDPTFFKTTLNDEYRLAARVFGFGADDLAQLALNGVRAAFLPADERAALERQFADELARL
ncbi:MAG TPA: adenosine deaminase [Kouleothrix sp.]|uniref:adenosine deaminase n=1 Tax=Kouleothrix sp. TaxID=2779161 RepID=UPI002BC9F62C|nr:adenosine deaminase [Kouleothrix sp.]HRC74279.1 adenosine deaminase [Kouleothrix sp.]